MYDVYGKSLAVPKFSDIFAFVCPYCGVFQLIDERTPPSLDNNPAVTYIGDLPCCVCGVPISKIQPVTNNGEAVRL